MSSRVSLVDPEALKACCEGHRPGLRHRALSGGLPPRIGVNLTRQRQGKESCSTDGQVRLTRGHGQNQSHSCNPTRGLGVVSRRRDGPGSQLLARGRTSDMGRAGLRCHRWIPHTGPQGSGPMVLPRAPPPAPHPRSGPGTFYAPSPTWPRDLLPAPPRPPPRAVLVRNPNLHLGSPATSPGPLTSERALGSS